MCTRRSIPNRSIRRLKPKLADTTPMEPTIEDGSAKISSPAQAIMYPPEAAASSTKTSTGSFFSSASDRTRLKMRCDCAAEPPGELITSATAFRPGSEKARSSMGAVLAIDNPGAQRHGRPDRARQANHRDEGMLRAEPAGKQELEPGCERTQDGRVGHG